MRRTLLFLSFFVTHISIAQWTTQTSNTTENLNSVFSMPNGMTAWIGGTNGTYLKTTNGGTTWVSQNFGSDHHDIFFRPDALHGWMSNDGGISYTTNGGTSWTTVPILDQIFAVHFFDDLNGLATGASGNIYHTNNGGTSWIPQSIGPATLVLSDIKFGADANTAWVIGTQAGNDPKIFKLTKAGGVWTPALQYSAAGTGPLYTLAVINNSVAWAVGQSPNFLRTTDGTNWVLQNIPTNGDPLYGFDALSANRAMGASISISAYYTSNGINWMSEQINNPQTIVYDIFIASNTIAFAVGNNGTIYKTTSFVLPIDLFSYTVKTNEDQVTLNWQTSNEINNKGFDILRHSYDGKIDVVGYVPSKGEGSIVRSYNFTDRPSGGTTFWYQLRQIDIDGKQTLSNKLRIKLEISKLAIRSYPNPSWNTATLTYSLPIDTKVVILMKDQMGNTVRRLVNAEQKAGNYAQMIDLTSLPSGQYYVELNTSQKKRYIKISVQH